jgi:DNA repair ATPase RecN
VPKIVLRSLKTNSGFLESAPVAFHPGLNCIIGARGTCKSTIVESLRFALGDDQEAREVIGDGIILTTLKAGTARCEISVNAGTQPQQFVVEREIGGDPRIFEDGVKQYDSKELLRCAEIFSQGDLQRIASDSNQELRLSLIDRPNRTQISKLKDERKKHLDSLRQIGANLRAIRSELEQRKVEIRDLDRLRSELHQTTAGRPELSAELSKQHSAYQERQKALEQIRSAQEVQGQLLQALNPVPDLFTRLRTINEGLSPSARTVAFQGLDPLQKAITEILNAKTVIARCDLVRLYSDIAESFSAADQQYFTLRQEQQALNESLKREESFRKQIEHLEKAEKRLRDLLQEEARLLKSRTTMRLEVESASDQIYRLRATEVDAINKAHASAILLTLNHGALAPQYLTYLSTLLSGSRLKTQDDLARDLGEQLAPSELINYVEAGDAQSVAHVLNRDLGQITRVIAHLRDHADLYNIELHFYEDTLDITFYDNGTPKPVESLSKGQKATALLPLILRQSDQPLIFDQPEDDLDNSFIYRSLVQVIRTLKTHRQLIFVTHNANIPVLGEADRVIVMHMQSPTSAAIPLVGSVDERKQDILTLLEGGKEAFERRHSRYAELLRAN